ncbi:MAG: methyltransferase domain-containing protein [archaeon]
MKAIEYNTERAKRYSKAMRDYPDARMSELKNLNLNEFANKDNLTILDLGAGDGYLTNYLAEKFPRAKIYAVDNSEAMLSSANKQTNVIHINSESDNIPLESSSVDLVVSLATFHHINKKAETLKEIQRILSEDGLFVIADVLDKTKTQEFFDRIVQKHCITGHDFPFLNEEQVRGLVNSNNLTYESSKLKNTPWKFKTKEDMTNFIKNLLGLEITEADLLKILVEHFSISIEADGVYLGWQLGYHAIRKSVPTKRTQINHQMSLEEKEQFSEIIRKMPWLYEPILNVVQRNIKDVNSIIDVGCGDGYLLKLINSKFSNLRLTGIDIDDYFISRASKNYPFKFTSEGGEVTEKKGDIILCNLALHHFENPIKLIKNLYENSNRTLIISDQLRPKNKKELEAGLEKRKDFIGDKEVPFYEKNERDSILESYSKNELMKILNSVNIPFEIKFFDDDYYERFVVAFYKNLEDRK